MLGTNPPPLADPGRDTPLQQQQSGGGWGRGVQITATVCMLGVRTGMGAMRSLVTLAAIQLTQLQSLHCACIMQTLAVPAMSPLQHNARGIMHQW
jgi:hypothetical protein